MTAGPAVPAIAVRDLWRGFGRERVLRGLSLDVGAGCAVAILGPNGSGKSTFLRVLAGLLRPLRGAVRVFGEDPVASPRVRTRIGYVGHEPMLYAGLTVGENLRLFAVLYGVPDGPARAREVCALLDLGGHRDTPAGRLSRGLRQRAALARALLHEPDVLLLDEPLSGLDPDAASRLAVHLDGFRARGGTLVLATHHPAEAARLAGGTGIDPSSASRDAVAPPADGLRLESHRGAPQSRRAEPGRSPAGNHEIEAVGPGARDARAGRGEGAGGRQGEARVLRGGRLSAPMPLRSGDAPAVEAWYPTAQTLP